MKKTFTLLLMLLLSSMTFAQVSTWDGTWEPWTHGTGTEEDPFLIENAQQLAYLAFRVNNGLDAGESHISNPAYHYKLMVDIDLDGSETFQWTPIGYWNSDADYQCFGGSFDGNGHDISGLYLNSSIDRVGLFGFIDGATVEELTVLGTKVATSGGYAGGIIGFSISMVVTDCTCNMTDCISSSICAGGIVGNAQGPIIITACNYTGMVKVQTPISTISCCGGIIGYANGLTTVINNCNVVGTVTSSNSKYAASGGIVGSVGNCEIAKCYSSGGDISASIYSDEHSDAFGGGIVGYCGGIITINHCQRTGNVDSSVSGPSYYGGYRHSNSGGIIGYSTGAINTSFCFFVGGNCSSYQKGSSYGNYSRVGGIICSGNSTVDVTNCYNICSLSATGDGSVYSGGIVGYKNGGSVTNCYYLNTCGGFNDYGGLPMSSDAMRTAEFVTILNAGSLTYKQDTQPCVNDGYPIFSGFSINTQLATSVSYTSAILNGSYTSDCYNIISQGFEYKKTTEQDYTIVNCTAGQSHYAYDVRDLTHNTSYHYRAFVIAAEGSAYGELVEFTTPTLPSYTITASSSNGGNINPTGNITVYEGESQTFTITPASDYVIQSVLVDGESVGTPSSYTFENINENHTISVSFRSLIHHITSTASGHGTISPNGDIIVQEGQNKTFTITPDPGFEIAALVVDNDTIEPSPTYTFSNVTQNHTIAASFSEMTGPCLPPLNLIVNVIDATSVRMSWQGGADVYVIAYGSNDTYNHAASTSENSIVITDLLPQSSYVWKIKSVCGDLETEYVDGQPFITSGHGVGEGNSDVFSLWPNPARETLNVIGENIEKIDVFNMQGQAVLSVSTHDVTTVLGVSNLNSGLYLVRITDVFGNSWLDKLIIM